MPTLLIRHFPRELYDKLLADAKAERRSLAQHTIVLLEEARQRRREALERLLARPAIPSMDIAALVREDRDR